MKLNHIPRAKMLLGIIPAFLLALVMLPAAALANPVGIIQTDGHGGVDTNELTVASYGTEYIGYDDGTGRPSTVESVQAGWLNGPVVVSPNDNYEFAYWTANADIYTPWENDRSGLLKLIPEGTHIERDFLCNSMESMIYISKDTTFTAHFRRTTPYTLTYETDGNGTVEPASEQVQDGNSPAGPTKLTPKDGYEFSHWTANVDVTLADGVIYEGNAIAADELTQILVDDDITFTAHFKETGSDPVTPDSDPDDSSDKVKPADGTSDKVLPKTGNSLPGTAASITLGAGCVIAAGALLVRKHSCQK